MYSEKKYQTTSLEICEAADPIGGGGRQYVYIVQMYTEYLFYEFFICYVTYNILFLFLQDGLNKTAHFLSTRGSPKVINSEETAM